MKRLLQLFGILLILLGIYWLLNPEFVHRTIVDNTENPSLYIGAIVIRFVLGILLVLTAKESRYPTLIKALGFLSIIAATTFLLVGQELFQSFLSNVIPMFHSYSPISAFMSMVAGGFLFYAFLGKEKNE